MDSVAKKKAVDELVKSTDGLTAEEFEIVCMYFALLVNPETKAKATEFGNRIIGGETNTFSDLKNFCLSLQGVSKRPQGISYSRM